MIYTYAYAAFLLIWRGITVMARGSREPVDDAAYRHAHRDGFAPVSSLHPQPNSAGRC